MVWKRPREPMETLMMIWNLLLGILLYAVVALCVMYFVDVTTNRITRFIGRQPWKAYLFLFVWPILAIYVFLPRYRVRRDKQLVGKPKPFAKA